MTATGLGEGRRRTAGTHLAPRIALLLLLCLAATSHSAPPRPAGLMDELRRELGGLRPVLPMLSVSREHAACSVQADTSAIPRSRCAPPSLSPRARRRINAIAARASAAIRSSADPDALHAAAIIDLVFSTGDPPDRPIEYLQKAARLADRPGAPLADLAAALLVRAERTQDAQDLYEAVEVASRATRLAGTPPAAHFNLALALETAGVSGEASAEWKRFLARAPEDGWKAEARERQARTLRPVSPPPPPALDAPAAAFERYAARDAQGAREWGWDVLLARWGAAWSAGDTACAAAHLRAADAVGTALERQGRDATLADGVRAVRQAPAAALPTLARAHALWARARARFATDHGAARASFARLIEMAPRSAPLVRWARIQHAAGLVAAAEHEAAFRVLEPIMEDADSARFPAVRAAALALLSTAHLRDTNHQLARDLALRSMAVAQTADEREGQGRGLELRAEAEFFLGANREAYGTLHRSISVLRATPRSKWLHNALSVLGEELAQDGRLFAAEHFYNEDVAVTSGHRVRIYSVEALVYRAELRAALQDAAGAALDYQTADSLLQTIPSSQPREWLKGDALAAYAATLLRRDPRRSVELLDSALALPDSAQTVLRRLATQLSRAEARLALTDLPGATADLEAVTRALRAQHDRISNEALRASLLDAARSVFDRMVMLHVNAGRPADALEALERGRASLAPGRGGGTLASADPMRTPPGETVLEYAVVGDTLLTWILRDGSMRFVRGMIDRETLLRDAERARTLLESGGSDATLRPLLSGLYDLLIRPVDGALGPGTSRVVLIVDGELGAVPFAALYDARRERYLVQDYVPRYAANLAEAFPVPAPARSTPSTVLLAAGPPTIPQHPELQPLTENLGEVRAIAGLYGEAAEELAGPGATAAALTRELRGAWLLHFAGHALIHDARPEQSSLLLHGDTAGAAIRLTAEELGRADLRHVRLIVLSACETLRARDGRSGGLAGFSGALLAAGAGGVLGSTWRVDDRLARELMVPFHRFYRQSRDGPAALRQAQLALLASPDPSLRSPAAWAGFRYAGN